MLLMPVHDELVFEVPFAEIDLIKMTVERTMIQAADELLRGEVPVELRVVLVRPGNRQILYPIHGLPKILEEPLCPPACLVADAQGIRACRPRLVRNREPPRS
jgi:hypothetical protein